MQAFARRWMDILVQRVRARNSPVVVWLEGDLGAGKSFLVRSLIRMLDPYARVKSPTYTLVEPYEINGLSIYHWDLYRLCDPEELEYMGARELFAPGTLHFVEWAEKGKGFMQQADIVIKLKPCGHTCREIEVFELA